MSQATNWTIGANPSGTNFRSYHNDSMGAIGTNHSGTSRPSYIGAGGHWLDTASGVTAWKLKLYDGADDILFGTFNTTANTFTPNNAITPSCAEIYGADSVGTDSYAVTLSPAPTAYTTGMMVIVKFGTANTGGATLALNGMSAKTIVKNKDEALDTGDILANMIGILVYDGTNFELLNVSHKDATQTQMEAASDLQSYVAPGVQHFHPSAVKCWGYATVSGAVPTLQVNYNLTSITDTATGRVTFTIATDFSGANWACFPGTELVTSGNPRFTNSISQLAGSVILEACNSGASLTDPNAWSFAGLGDI